MSTCLVVLSVSPAVTAVTSTSPSFAFKSVLAATVVVFDSSAVVAVSAGLTTYIV